MHGQGVFFFPSSIVSNTINNLFFLEAFESEEKNKKVALILLNPVGYKIFDLFNKVRKIKKQLNSVVKCLTKAKEEQY